MVQVVGGVICVKFDVAFQVVLRSVVKFLASNTRVSFGVVLLNAQYTGM